MATRPVSLDVVVVGIRHVWAVEEGEHDEMVNVGGCAHIGRMVPIRTSDPLPA
jgi:hypothetical protein